MSRLFVKRGAPGSASLEDEAALRFSNKKVADANSMAIATAFTA